MWVKTIISIINHPPISPSIGGINQTNLGGLSLFYQHYWFWHMSNQYQRIILFEIWLQLWHSQPSIKSLWCQWMLMDDTPHGHLLTNIHCHSLSHHTPIAIATLIPVPAPVPGGPWMSPKLKLETAQIAASCDALSVLSAWGRHAGRLGGEGGLIAKIIIGFRWD